MIKYIMRIKIINMNVNIMMIMKIKDMMRIKVMKIINMIMMMKMIMNIKEIIRIKKVEYIGVNVWLVSRRGGSLNWTWTPPSSSRRK